MKAIEKEIKPDERVKGEGSSWHSPTKPLRNYQNTIGHQVELALARDY